MSWGITCTTGDPAAVKKALVSQFKNATACVASNPHEVETVNAAAVIDNSQLDFMIESGFRVLLDPHDLGELAGQRWIELLLTEPDVDPKEAA